MQGVTKRKCLVWLASTGCVSGFGALYKEKGKHMLSAHEADAGVPALNALCTNVEIYCCGKNRNANQQTNPAFEGY